MLGASLYILFRRLLGETKHPTAWALGLSLVCLSDAGFVDGRTLVENYGLVWHMLQGSTPLGKADALGQFRVVTLLLNLPFLLLMVASLAPNGPGRRAWVILGAACLGLCFHLYFFYWTAAVPALLASALTSLVVGVREGRWSNVLPTELVLAGGLAIGLPQVYSNARTYSNPEYRPILERMCRGRVLAPDDPVRTRYLANTWAWGKIVVGGLAILAFRPRGLALVWWLTFFGFAMANSALVTGLEFENFHWVYVHAPMGEILILAIVARLLDRWNPGRAIRNRLLWVVPIGLLTVAAIWRPYEAISAPEARQLSWMLDQLRGLEPILAQLGPDDLLVEKPFLPSVVLLLTRSGLLYQDPHSYLSSILSERSIHERHALSFWLCGFERPGYPLLPGDFFVVPSGDTSRWSPEAADLSRMAIFDSIEADIGATMLDRYRLSALLLDAGNPPWPPQRGGPWRLLGENEHWEVWVRDRPR